MTTTSIRTAIAASIAAVVFAMMAIQPGQASAASSSPSSAQSMTVDPVLATVALVMAGIVMTVALVGMHRK